MSEIDKESEAVEKFESALNTFLSNYFFMWHEAHVTITGTVKFKESGDTHFIQTHEVQIGSENNVQ